MGADARSWGLLRAAGGHASTVSPVVGQEALGGDLRHPSQGFGGAR